MNYKYISIILFIIISILFITSEGNKKVAYNNKEKERIALLDSINILNQSLIKSDSIILELNKRDSIYTEELNKLKSNNISNYNQLNNIKNVDMKLDTLKDPLDLFKQTKQFMK